MANDNKPDTSPLRAMAVRFHNTVKGQWPASTPFGQLARVQSAGFMSILAGTNKDGEFLRKILLENGGAVDYVAAFCMRTGLIPGAGDIPEFYIIPQSGFIRCSIAPAGWRIIANTAGYRVETHPVPIGSKVEFDLMGRVEEVNFSTSKPPTKLAELEGVLVELTHLESGVVNVYWVDGDTIRAKAQGKKGPWETHAIGMARSRALNMICKHHGPFAGVSADPARLGVRLDAASLTAAIAGQMDAAERAKAAAQAAAQPAPPSAAPSATQAQAPQPTTQPAQPDPESPPETQPEPEPPAAQSEGEGEDEDEDSEVEAMRAWRGSPAQVLATIAKNGGDRLVALVTNNGQDIDLGHAVLCQIAIRRGIPVDASIDVWREHTAEIKATKADLEAM